MSYSALPNERVKAGNGVDYAYRETCPAAGDAVPLVLLQHFRGNLDNWDPALVDALASDRRVVAFDNTGVAGSTGTTPSTVAQMAHDAIAFVDAMDLERIDLLGFSLGSFVAQEIVLIRPDLVRRLVLASAAPQGAAGMHGPDQSRLRRLAGIGQPTFVANGDSDPTILPRYSHLLAGLLPDARLTIYPYAAHGFLFQHHSQFASDVKTFLTEGGDAG